MNGWDAHGSGPGIDARCEGHMLAFTSSTFAIDTGQHGQSNGLARFLVKGRLACNYSCPEKIAWAQWVSVGVPPWHLVPLALPATRV